MPDARSAILMTLRMALADAPDPGPALQASATGPFGPADWTAFAAACENSGTHFTLAPDWTAAGLAVRGLFAELHVKSAGFWAHPDLEPLDLPSLCAELNIETAANTDALTRADIGVTSAHGALAESGSVLVVANPDTPRATSLLPTVHLAIIPPGRTVPGIADLPAFLRSQADKNDILPSAVHAITGPSSTGDIEMVVVKGVHGPVRVFVVAVAE